MSQPELTLELNPQLRPLCRFVGESAAAEETRNFALRVASSPHTVLLFGETGVGKDHLARIIHDLYRLDDGHFVPIDCTTVSDTLLEDELFGHNRGAFTNASNEREGLVRRARRGTLFINEVGNMGRGLQAKLLHLLDGQPFRPIGSDREVLMEARVVAATNADLPGMVARGEFRQDLFFRLNSLPFTIPPLRKRKEDVPQLITAQINGQASRIRPEAMKLLVEYHWPGNVRQLQQVLRQALTLNDAPEISASDITRCIKCSEGIFSASDVQEWVLPGTLPTFRQMERQYWERLHRECKGNVKRMTKISGVSFKTVYNRLHAYGLRNLGERPPVNDDE